jgi:hypothetical protein
VSARKNRSLLCRHERIDLFYCVAAVCSCAFRIFHCVSRLLRVIYVKIFVWFGERAPRRLLEHLVVRTYYVSITSTLCELLHLTDLFTYCYIFVVICRLFCTFFHDVSSYFVRVCVLVTSLPRLVNWFSIYDRFAFCLKSSNKNAVLVRVNGRDRFLSQRACWCS